MAPMQAERRTPSKLLALLYVLSGLLCLVGAANPMRPDTPVALLWALEVVGSAGGAAIALLGARLRGWAIHAGVAFAGLLTALLAWRSATALGVVGLGPMLIALGLYAAHFLSLRAARLHVVMITVAASAGALAAKPSGFLMQWVVLAMSVLALTEVQGRLSERLRRVADTDPLTGLANRRAWEAEATRNLARAQRTGEPLSFAIIDPTASRRSTTGTGTAPATNSCANSRPAGHVVSARPTCSAATAVTSSCCACRRPTRRAPGNCWNSSVRPMTSRGRWAPRRPSRVTPSRRCSPARTPVSTGASATAGPGERATGWMRRQRRCRRTHPVGPFRADRATGPPRPDGRGHRPDRRLLHPG